MIQFSYILAVAVSVGGALVHWTKRYVRSQTDSGLLEYIFARDRFGTFTSFVSIAFSALVMVEKGTVDPLSFVGISTLFSIGYMCDSMFNSDKQAV